MLLLFNVILSLLSIGIIFLDLYCFAIPRFVSLFSIVALLAIIVLELIKENRRWKKILFTIINILVIVFVFLGTYCNPYRNSLTKRKINLDENCKSAYNQTLTYREAKSDLDMAIYHLKHVHPMFIHGLSDDVKQLYKQAILNLKANNNITVNDLCKEIETIYSCLGDGHTSVWAWYYDTHTLKYMDKHYLNKDKIVAVNGITIEEIFNKNRQYFSFETEESGMLRVAECLQTLENLDYLGFNVDNGITYTYVNINGEQFQETYYKNDFLTPNDYWAYNDTDNSRFNNANNSNEFVRYEIMPDKNLAVLTLDSCDYNDYYKKCLSDMFNEVKNKGIGNVCVDVRSNSGGASRVINEFLRYINIDSYRNITCDVRLGIFMLHASERDAELENNRYEDLVFNGNVYILTSTYSYSSAMDFAMFISDNHIGTVIGETPGNKANCYGDVLSFKLKNSDLLLRISFKKWYRIDKSNTDEFVEPNIKCKSEDALQTLIEHLNNQ